VSADEPTYSVVRLVAGDGKGLPVLLLHVTDEDVSSAREHVRAGEIGHMSVVIVVVSFLHALGVDPGAQSWTTSDYIELLEMLGMPPFEWTPLEDAELTRLLTEGAITRGQ
jgi:hypothetical protein